MKTLIFCIWTDLVEDFSKKIPHDQIELHDWFDTKGAQMFELGQREYFDAHQSEYLQIENNREIKFNLAYDQIIAGFDKVFAGIKKDFPALNSDDLCKNYEILRNECVNEKYFSYIASRAAITAQYAKLNPENRIENLKFVIERHQILIKAVQASINSMQAYLQKIPSVSISRGSSSPVLHKLSNLSIGETNLKHQTPQQLRGDKLSDAINCEETTSAMPTTAKRQP